MKKLGLLVMPLMAISLLASCNNGGGGGSSEYTLSITLDNCTIDGSSTYSKTYAAGKTIQPVTVEPTGDFVLTSGSVSEGYQQYWSNDGEWKLSGLVMDQNHTISISAGYVLINETPGVTIYPNVIVPNQEYEGRIFINDESINSKILPLSLDSVLISDETNANIASSCTYEVKDNNKDSYFEIPAEYAITNIRVNLTTKDIADARWKDYVNWWDYCSNGVEGVQASKENPNDVGTIVNVTVYDIPHAVRLIDVDHANVEGGAPEAHCTFEFADAIAYSYFEGRTARKLIFTHWDEENNYYFPDSTLNKLLNKNSDCIFNQLPSGLQGKIRTVNKMVGISNDDGDTYILTSYSTQLFPLAHDEILGHVDGAPAANEGTIYKYYDELTPDFSENPPDYWLRSPYLGYTELDVWKYMNEEATWFGGDGFIRDNLPIAPAFCI